MLKVEKTFSTAELELSVLKTPEERDLLANCPSYDELLDAICAEEFPDPNISPRMRRILAIEFSVL